MHFSHLLNLNINKYLHCKKTLGPFTVNLKIFLFLKKKCIFLIIKINKYIYIYMYVCVCVCVCTVMAKNISTVGKYDQRRLWKLICIVNPFDLLFKKFTKI